MASLVNIPGCTALHLPTPTSAPLPLSTGDLNLTLIPANPPTHPSATITLTVGSSSFPLLPKSPVQKVKAKAEHASYQFTPIPADGSAPVGAVRIQMQDSHNQESWDATEKLCQQFEGMLRTHNLWDDKVLFVNDEYETAGQPVQSWGASIASAVTTAANSVAAKIHEFTDGQVLPSAKKISLTVSNVPAQPGHPITPAPETVSDAAAFKDRTASIAESAQSGATRVGDAVHEGGKKLGGQLPDSIAQRGQPVPEHEKSDFRKMAEDAWSEATVAAKGLAAGATTVGKAMSESAHHAIEKNFGKPADDVAQDIGQGGANLGSAALSVGTGTSAIIQGANFTSGASKTASGGPA